MKTKLLLILVQIVTAITVTAKERETQAQGCGDNSPAHSVRAEIKESTHLKSLSILYGGRINGIIFNGADGNSAVFSGEKRTDGNYTVTFGPEEYLVGFRVLYKDKGRNLGWYKIQAIIDGPTGRRYSEPLGTGGTSNMKVLGFGRVTVGMQQCDILAPDGHEVVGLDGRAGTVINYARLITQKH